VIKLITPNNWKAYHVNSNEGIGTLYDRLFLEKVFDKVIKEYKIKSVVELPVVGMNGFCGLNCVHLAKKGIKVTIVDNDKKRLEIIAKMWKKIKLNAEFIYTKEFSKFKTRKKYDLVFSLGSLWFYNEKIILKKYNNLSNRLILILTHNPNQAIYGLWKKLEPSFFLKVNESLIKEKNFEKVLREELTNFELIKKEYVVNPPWPGIILTKKDIINLFRKKQEKKINKIKKIVLPDYINSYLSNPELKKKFNKFMLLEKMPVFLKKKWSHLTLWLLIKKQN